MLEQELGSAAAWLVEALAEVRVLAPGPEGGGTRQFGGVPIWPAGQTGFCIVKVLDFFDVGPSFTEVLALKFSVAEPVAIALKVMVNIFSSLIALLG